LIVNTWPIAEFLDMSCPRNDHIQIGNETWMMMTVVITHRTTQLMLKVSHENSYLLHFGNFITSFWSLFFCKINLLKTSTLNCLQHAHIKHSIG